MSKRTDEDLVKIVTVERDGYQPLAVEAAEGEIKNRNIGAARIAQIASDLTIKIEEQKELDAKKVGSLTRFIHFIIDTVAVLILGFLVATAIGLLISPGDERQLATITYVTLAATFFVYYVLMESKYQKTIGKFITKTRVINSDGTKPKMGDILRRTLLRLIPFDRISFLIAGNGFHDRLSDTTIIRDDI